MVQMADRLYQTDSRADKDIIKGIKKTYWSYIGVHII